MSRDNFASLLGNAEGKDRKRVPSKLVDSDGDCEVYEPVVKRERDAPAPDMSRGGRPAPGTVVKKVVPADDDDGAEIIYSRKRQEPQPEPEYQGPPATPKNQDPRKVRLQRREGIEHVDFEVESKISLPNRPVHEEMLYEVMSEGTPEDAGHPPLPEDAPGDAMGEGPASPGTRPGPAHGPPAAPQPSAAREATADDAEHVERLGRLLRPRAEEAHAAPMAEESETQAPLAPLRDAEGLGVEAPEEVDLSSGPQTTGAGAYEPQTASGATAYPSRTPLAPVAQASGGAMPAGTGGFKPPQQFQKVEGAPAGKPAPQAASMPNRDPLHQAAQPLPQGAAANAGVQLGFVVSEFHPDVTGPMLERARAHAEWLAAPVTQIVPVAGVFDIPLAAQRLAARSDVTAVVVLGAVVTGETHHDEVIVHATAKSLQELSLRVGKPVGLGITGPGQSKAQAVARVGRAKDAVEAAVKMQLRTKNL